MTVPMSQAIDLLHAVYVHSGITGALHGWNGRRARRPVCAADREHLTVLRAAGGGR